MNLALAALLAAAALSPGAAPPASLPPPAAASGASGAIDPAAATRAWLDQLPAAQRARSDAYFEGGYWLSSWSFLWEAAVLLLLLVTGLSARMRSLAERATRFAALQTLIYWAQFLLATAALSFPLSLYRDYFREHQYGLLNLTLSGFLGEQLKGFFVSLVLGGGLLVALYAVARRLPRSWWLWGAGVAIFFFVIVAVIAPVAIVPLFNTPRKLADQRVAGPILSLARANGIEAGEVWEIDASKQTKRISANVSGFLGTQRITLNDNLLNRCSLPEIESVMGHEMGHYVLNHVYKFIWQFGVLIVVGFALIHRFFERLRERYAARFLVRSIGDVAGLPLVLLLLSSYLFLLTPLLNTLVRTAEQEADMFGLNAARQPDGFAQTALKLSEYRKLEPGPIEELVFFDHPSGRTRILSAMRWKAEHPETWRRAVP